MATLKVWAAPVAMALIGLGCDGPGSGAGNANGTASDARDTLVPTAPETVLDTATTFDTVPDTGPTTAPTEPETTADSTPDTGPDTYPDTGPDTTETVTCTNTCVEGTTSCSGTTGFRACERDSSGCAVPGPFVGCQDANACSATTCQGACTTPELVLVVDRSSSMSGSAWGWLSAATSGFLQKRYATVQTTLRFFPGPGETCQPGPFLGPHSNDPTAFATAFEAPALTSATPIAAALADVASVLGDPNQAERVVLITDGTETCQTEDDARAAVRALRHRGALVHVVAVGAGPDLVFLDALAALGGTTKAVRATDATSLRSALDAVLTAAGATCPASADGLDSATCSAGTCDFVCPEPSVREGDHCLAPCPAPLIREGDHCREPCPTDVLDLGGACLPGALVGEPILSDIMGADIIIDANDQPAIFAVSADSKLRRYHQAADGSWVGAVVGDAALETQVLADARAATEAVAYLAPGPAGNVARLWLSGPLGTASIAVYDVITGVRVRADNEAWVTTLGSARRYKLSGGTITQVGSDVSLTAANRNVFRTAVGPDGTLHILDDGNPTSYAHVAADGSVHREPVSVGEVQYIHRAALTVDDAGVVSVAWPESNGSITFAHRTDAGWSLESVPSAGNSILNPQIALVGGAPWILVNDISGSQFRSVISVPFQGGWQTGALSPYAQPSYVPIVAARGPYVAMILAVGNFVAGIPRFRHDLYFATFGHVPDPPPCSGDGCPVDPGDPGAIVINELEIDTVGADAGTYLELRGPPGTSLSGWSIEAINGGNGTDYASIALTGTIAANGTYLIVDASASAALKALADQIDDHIDLQNGPDSVQLRHGATIVDALAYGTFGASDTAAGEGTPAAAPPANTAQVLGRDHASHDTNDNADDFSVQVASPKALNP